MIKISNIQSDKFTSVRKQTESICQPLSIEDYVVQPTEDVSPPKWHLAHTTWFFENFVLVPYVKEYKLFNNNFSYLFNSYYIAVGNRWLRANRGNLSRPGVEEIYQYRLHVDRAMKALFQTAEKDNNLTYLIEVGLQHEQQHQELLFYDIKYILGHNPLYPPYKNETIKSVRPSKMNWLQVEEGKYKIGHQSNKFCFDNEKGVHFAYLMNFQIADRLISNEEYLSFIDAGGYQTPNLWLSEGWDWVNKNDISSPLYWRLENNKWFNYTLFGYRELDMNEPVSHVSYYEADAFARWAGKRLPTEFEWEVACSKYNSEIPEKSNLIESRNYRPLYSNMDNQFYGNLWEWTESAYRPYPYFNISEGALGEYNGKFMINQMVLRGGSYATPRDHIRSTYRNFFHPNLQWMFSGIRLAEHIK